MITVSFLQIGAHGSKARSHLHEGRGCGLGVLEVYPGEMEVGGGGAVLEGGTSVHVCGGVCEVKSINVLCLFTAG